MSVDLRTDYLGLALRTPIIASAGPYSRDLDHVRQLVDAGMSAVVLPSLFEEEVLNEEIELTAALDAMGGHSAEAMDFFPDDVFDNFDSPADRYLSHVAAVKAAVDVPVIASLNATSTGAWTSYARLMADAGADALELNLYHVAADPDRTGQQVEEADEFLVGEIAGLVDIPVAVKVSPFYSSMGNIARRFVDAGAAGLVLFNRFYQPDIDPDTRTVTPSLELSSAWELRLPLRWIALLRPSLPGVSLAASTGIASGRDVAKALLVGADVAMITSAVLRHGPGHVGVVEAELVAWADEHGYESVAQLRGSVSAANAEHPDAFERANSVRTLHSYTLSP